MSLIYISVCEHSAMTAIADILISRPSTSPGKLNIPTRRDPVELVRGGMTPATVTQKLTIAGGRTVLLWVGSRAVARTIVAAAYRDSDEGRNYVHFPDWIMGLGLSADELASVSIIYFYFTEEAPHEWHLNADQGRLGEGFHVYSGTGSWDFLKDSVVEDDDDSGDHQERDLFRMLSRVIWTVVNEALTAGNLDYLYGGWLELALLEKGNLAKIPYAIKFWHRRKDGGLDADLPLFFSWYRQHDLFIGRYFQKDKEIAVHQVSDFIDRSSIEGPEISIQWEPRIVCHVVITEGSEDASIHIRKDMPDEFWLEWEGMRSTLRFKQSLIEYLMISSKPDVIRFNVRKLSDPSD